MKNKGGAPTEYRDKFIQETYDYIKVTQDELAEFHKTRGEKSDSYERTIKVDLPTVESLAMTLGVAYTSVTSWEKKLDSDGQLLYPEFSSAVGAVRSEQHKRLLNAGLSGDYNASIAKLILGSNHGYREKSDVTTDGKKLEGIVYLPQKSDE